MQTQYYLLSCRLLLFTAKENDARSIFLFSSLRRPPQQKSVDFTAAQHCPIKSIKRKGERLRLAAAFRGASHKNLLTFPNAFTGCAICFRSSRLISVLHMGRVL